jgi:hypothetical protein
VNATVAATARTVGSENMKWRNLSRCWCIMEKRNYGSGTVVLSYGWKNTVLTTDGVMEKCIVFTYY